MVDRNEQGNATEENETRVVSTASLHRRSILAARLHVGQKYLWRIRLGIGMTMIFLGLALTALYELSSHMLWDELVWRRPYIVWDFCGEGSSEHVFWSACISTASYYTRYLCFGLAPLVDDLRAMRAVIVLDMFVTVVSYLPFAELYINSLHHYPDNLTLATIVIVDTLAVVGFLGGSVLALTCREPVVMQRYLWCSLRIWLVGWLLCVLVWMYHFWALCKVVIPLWTNIPCIVILMYCACRPVLRQEVHARLNRLIISRVALRAAAGLASMIGDRSVKQALSEGTERFRSILLADLAAEDVVDRKREGASDPNYLFRRSVPGTSCDAFVSHSWDDDPAAKWAALQQWRSTFIAQHGREPWIWFDKACMDQTNLNDETWALPVYLGNCDSLLILSGIHYWSRLWCVLELFVYFHMGGNKVGPLEVLPVYRNGHEQEDKEAIDQAMADFDAALCRCGRDEDTERLQNIIQAGFGSLGEFNVVLQSSLVSVGVLASSESYNVSAESSSTSNDSHSSGEGP
mmetsp:Transcript_19513/g.52358  ORF Transcript_19513/g.52358 Transcript_19513/m.52358 type:complete len:518 (+) Transcript_19513:114-1667(+)